MRAFLRWWINATVLGYNDFRFGGDETERVVCGWGVKLAYPTVSGR